MPSETFKKHRLIDRVDSSAGYSVRLRRDRVEYVDAVGTLVIEAEWVPRRGANVNVFTSTLTSEVERQKVVLENIAKALEADGWHLRIRE